MINLLTCFLFASQVANVFGTLTIIREVNNATERKLTCLSEDDGSALVWNDVISEKSLNKSHEMPRIVPEFHNVLFYNDTSKRNKSKIDCKMSHKVDNCWKLWDTKKWAFTDSLKTPMGPVFDQRWEEFVENETSHGLNRQIDLKNAKAFSFSVRNQFNELDVILCYGPTIRKDFCYWIIIGAWHNSKSAIRKCPEGIPKNGSKNKTECDKLMITVNHNPLSPTEWRTFLIMWDSVTRNISVYDAANNNVFMRYQDDIKGQANGPKSSNAFISSASPMFYRFHIYSFLHTRTENAVLRSPVFQVYDRAICIQLLIGLCAKCDVNITLYDATRHEELEKFRMKGSSTATHDLPTWQFVTVKHLTDRNSAIMELKPVLTSRSSHPLWAVANVRQCPRNGSVRGSTMLSNVQNNSTWPDVTCQKLFYNDHVVVSALGDAKENIISDDAECPEGRFGSRCLISYNHICTGNNCRGSAICDKNNCTCFSDYMGSDCTKPSLRVTKLEVYEIDDRQNPPVIYLRWQSSPFDGILRIYRIQSCSTDECISTYVQLSARCNLWDDYICGSIQAHYNGRKLKVQVISYNNDLMETGVPVFVALPYNTNPDMPIFTVTILKNSIANLRWRHPWKTGNSLKQFRIEICVISTNLQKFHEKEDTWCTNIAFAVTSYAAYYSKQLYLLPSTRYSVGIQAITYARKFGKIMHVTFETLPMLKFNGHLNYKSSGTTIVLNIPIVVNNTKNSLIHIIVKGLPEDRFCKDIHVPEDLRVRAGINVNDDAWQAAELPTQELAGELFIVGDNKFYGKAKNCPLQPKELYEIIVILAESNQSFSESDILKILVHNDEIPSMMRFHEKWIIPIILIIIGAIIALYFYRRKRQKTIKQKTLQNGKTSSQDVTRKETQDETYVNEFEAKSSDSSEQQQS